MSDTTLKLPLKLMSLEALRQEEDRLIDDLHRIRDRRDAVGAEIMRRLEDRPPEADGE